MRPALFSLALVLVAGCDTAPAGDLDVGSFRGFDASSSVQVHGWAFHNAARSDAAGLDVVEFQFEISAGPDYAGQTVEVSIPRTGALRTGTYQVSGNASAAVTRWAGGDRTVSASVVEVADLGTVAMTDVQVAGGHAELSGTVEITFPSGVLTGTFRAVDDSRPTPASHCDRGGCVDY